MASEYSSSDVAWLFCLDLKKCFRNEDCPTHEEPCSRRLATLEPMVRLLAKKKSTSRLAVAVRGACGGSPRRGGREPASSWVAVRREGTKRERAQTRNASVIVVTYTPRAGPLSPLYLGNCVVHKHESGNCRLLCCLPMNWGAECSLGSSRPVEPGHASTYLPICHGAWGR